MQSVYQPDTPVNGSGGFSTTVSSQGAHLLAVTDNGGQLRALGLSMPGAAGAAALAVPPHLAARANAAPMLDATSTAIALIFLTPGIVATAPSAAATRITQIQGLNSFAPLVAYLSSNLASSSLPSLIQAGTLTTLAYPCVQEWQNTYNSTSQTGQARPHASGGKSFTAAFGAGPANATPVSFSNGEFRYVNVVRRSVNAADADLVSPQQIYTALPGASGPDIASLLTLSIAKPDDDGKDVADLTIPNLSAVEYWVRGPGVGSTANLPSSVAAISDGTAIGVSVLLYLFLPLLDAVLSLDGVFEGNEIFDDLTNAWEQYSPGIDTANIISGLATGDKGATIVGAIVAIIKTPALMKALLEIVAKNVSLASALYIGVAQVVKILTFLSQVLDVMTVLIAVGAWETYPNIAKISLPVNSTGTVGVTVQ